MIKIYSLSELAYKAYKENTSRGKDCSRYVAELKFSAMIAATPHSFSPPNLGSYIYRIGTFNLVVRKGLIAMVYWGTKEHPVSGKAKELMLSYYKELGLTENGNDIIRDTNKYEDDKLFVAKKKEVVATRKQGQSITVKV